MPVNEVELWRNAGPVFVRRGKVVGLQNEDGLMPDFTPEQIEAVLYWWDTYGHDKTADIWIVGEFIVVAYLMDENEAQLEPINIDELLEKKRQLNREFA